MIKKPESTKIELSKNVFLGGEVLPVRTFSLRLNFQRQGGQVRDGIFSLEVSRVCLVVQFRLEKDFVVTIPSNAAKELMSLRRKEDIMSRIRECKNARDSFNHSGDHRCSP